MRPRTPPATLRNARERAPAIFGALCATVAIFAYLMGDGYIDRLPNHAGYFLLPVEDTVGVPLARPRHAVVILVDGLSKSTAEGFASKRRLEAAGQCRTMVGGPITVSRPMYAVLSTGLKKNHTNSK